MGAWWMTGAGVSDVEADEVGMDIVADVCSYPDQKTWGHENSDISGTISQNDLNFWHNLSWGVS